MIAVPAYSAGLCKWLAALGRMRRGNKTAAEAQAISHGTTYTKEAAGAIMSRRAPMTPPEIVAIANGTIWRACPASSTREADTAPMPPNTSATVLDTFAVTGG